jgi:metal-responsive CopG/Arc/MetJ family transcriptional regulator
MKKEKSTKYLTIRIPETLMGKFQEKCAENYKTMSEALRDFIQLYIKK